MDDWQQLANCRDPDVDPDWWFAYANEPEVKLAKQVCTWCVVRDHCLRRGTGERYGVWGGLTFQERETLAAEPELPLEGDLPGMWAFADFLGGDPDERSHAEREAPDPSWRCA